MITIMLCLQASLGHVVLGLCFSSIKSPEFFVFQQKCLMMNLFVVHSEITNVMINLCSLAMKTENSVTPCPTCITTHYDLHELHITHDI
jgi:hypothetical protein